MSDPQRVFIKISPDWSYNYIGGLSEFCDLSPKVMETYYDVACQYLVIRHNFIAGHMDNVNYTNALYTVFSVVEHNGTLDATVKYACETLYRMVSAALITNPGKVEHVSYVNDNKGDVQGLVVHYAVIAPISTLQFP